MLINNITKNMIKNVEYLLNIYSYYYFWTRCDHLCTSKSVGFDKTHSEYSRHHIYTGRRFLKKKSALLMTWYIIYINRKNDFAKGSKNLATDFRYRSANNFIELSK